MKKHNTIKTLCLAAAMLLGGFAAKAQLQPGFEQSVYLNGTLPVGAMAEHVAIITDGGSQILGLEHIGENATLGFGAGYRVAYRFDVGFGQMAPTFSADFLWNQVRSDMRDANTMNGYTSVNYFNIPLLVGLAYYYDGFDIFTPFAEAGLGYDFLLITPEGKKADDLWLRYKVKNALAWQVGAGCYFGSHVSLSLHYYALGKHFVSFSDRSQWPSGTEIYDCMVHEQSAQTKPISVSQLLLRVGFHF